MVNILDLRLLLLFAKEAPAAVVIMLLLAVISILDFQLLCAKEAPVHQTDKPSWAGYQSSAHHLFGA